MTGHGPAGRAAVALRGRAPIRTGRAVIEGCRSANQVREDSPAPDGCAPPRPGVGDGRDVRRRLSAKGVCHEFDAEAV